MGLGAEAFTVLAILEARDRASEIFGKVDEALGKFSETASSAADAAKGAGDEIDESLLSTASGADALEVATAKVAAAQAKAAGAADAQAQAEQRLLAVTSQGVASEEEQAAAASELAAAQGRAAEAQALATEASSAQAAALAALAAESAEGSAAAGLYADANGKLRNSAGQFVSAADAQEIAVRAVSEAEDAGSASADALAAANERAATAQKAVADASAEVAAAQARQAGLVTADTQVAAAQNLAKAEKTAQSASSDLTAAQKTQAATQKALAASTDEAKAAAEAEAAAQKQAAADSEASSALLGKVGKVAGISAIGLGVAGGLMVKAAGNFQDATTHLQTDAGVTKQNLGMVQAGILQVSTATGQSATDITNAMYHIASSGFTAQNGLNILKIAAEGARVGGADLDTTTKTLVGTMTAYYGSNLSAGAAMKDSTSLMNQMIETVSRGDMRMQDLASSLSAVTPVAAAAHISFAQVGGAIATMTAQGMSARQATQDLAHTIRSLASPTNVQAVEMKALGLNANTVAKNLGTTGLAGTLNQMRNAVLSNTSGGYVMLNLLKGMTPATQGLANQILAGTITTNGLTQAVKGLNPEQAALIGRFKTSATSVTGLKQTFTGAMYKMLGGATGLNTALMLTGKHMGDLTTSTAKIAAEGKKASGTVDNWSTIQGTFAFKMSQAKTAVENTGIAIGSALLPAATAVISAVGKVLVPVAEWTAKHKPLTEVIFVGVTALAATVAVLALATKAFKAVKGAVDEVKAAYNGVAALSRKVAGVFKQTADTQVKSARDAASAEEDAAAESAEVQEEKAGEAAAAEETAAGEAAAAQEEAAAESSAGWIRAAAATVAGWAKTGIQMVAQAAVWVAQNTAKVAVVVAENVAGAAVTAAAWIAANALMLLGIGLVIAAVVIAVVEIVKHWSAITAAVSKVWDAVYDYTSKIIGDVISFIRSHWQLIVGIFLGPIALVVTEVASHWKLIEHWFVVGVQAVEKALSWFTGLQARFRAWLAGAASAVVSEGARIIGWFTSLPGRVIAEVDHLASMLFGSGEHVIESLANGITSAASGALHGAMSFVTNTIKSFLPFSPAKQGPLSGAGDPGNSGRSIAGNLAKGITAATPQAAAAALAMAARVQSATSGLSARSGAASIGSSLAASAVGPASGAGNGGVTIVLNVTGNTVMGDSDMDKLVNKLGKRLASVTLPAGGRKLNIRG